MATWNPFAIWLVVAGIVGFSLLIALLIAQWKEKKKKKGKPAARDPVRVNENVGPRRRVRNARNRMNAARRNERDEDDDDNDYNDVGDDEGGVFPMAFDDQMPTGKIGTKKLRKMEMKAEKRAMREQIEAEREDRKEREALREAERKRDEEKRKQEEVRRQEEERIRKEEEEKKAHEEYLAMKEAFLVEEEGVGETEEESQALLQDFIKYIKDKKVVMLEDLACQFGLRTQEAINRLQILQESEQITGVIDDRGKFIYISKEELESVAKFIRQRGRVTITDLAESSNKLINLQANTGQVEATA